MKSKKSKIFGNSKKSKTFPSKKGMMMPIVVMLILFVMISLILISFFYPALLFGKERADIEACRLSVLATSKMTFEGIRETLGFQLNCPAHEVEIKLTDSNKISKQIANEMYDCWYKMGNGKVNPFPKGFFEIESKKFCVICSEIKFSDKTKRTVTEIPNFVHYLIDTTIPNSDLSYYDYLSGTVKVEGSVKEELRKKNIVDKIDTGQSYYILYSVFRRNLWEKTIGVIGGAAGGIGLVALFGGSIISLPAAVVGGGLAIVGYSTGAQAEDRIYAISLIPREKLQEIDCDYLVQ